MELIKNRFYCLDCIKGLKKIGDEQVDMILSSPPYDDIRNYGNKNNQINFKSLGQEISRVLKFGGICIMVMNDRTNYCKSLTSFRMVVDWHDNTDLKLWEDAIYARDGNPGAYWNKRFRVDHEHIFIFLKMKNNKTIPQYFNKQHLLIPTKCGGVKWGGYRRLSNGKIAERKNIIVKDKKCCGTIFRYNASNKEHNKLKNQHPATFPDKLAEDMIIAFTKEGMLVVDMFMGSGTTGVMANKNKRDFIGFDINKQYVALARKRLNGTN